MSPARGAALALVVAASAGCAFLAHRAMSHGESPRLGMLVSLIPLAVIVVTLARRMNRAAALLLLAAAAGLAAWIGWAPFERHFADLFFLEHAGMMLVLAIVFGRTLLPDEEPLCTRFARIVHGSLDESVARYTRRLTLTWTVFFATIFAASCTLYATHRIEAWSFLASILTPSLVAMLFLVEYAVRRRALPQHARYGILAAVHAFRRHVTGSEAPR